MREAPRQDITYDSLREDQFDAFIALYRRCFGDARTSECFLRQRYDFQNEPRSMVLAAWSGQELVGAQALTFLQYGLRGKVTRGALLTSGMVHPSVRGRGVFRRLVEECSNVARARGLSVMITLPNGSSVPTFARAQNWVVSRRRLWIRPVIPRLLLSDDGVPCEGHAVSQDETPRMVRRLNELAGRVASEFEGGMCIRDFAFLRWRYLDNRKFRYQLSVLDAGEGSGKIMGFVSLRKVRVGVMPAVFLVDWLATGETAMKAVVDTAASFARRNRAAVIAAIADQDCFSVTLRRNGFLQVPDAILRRRFHTAVWCGPGETIASRYVTLGDFDAA